jgi:hypothetical protein
MKVNLTRWLPLAWALLPLTAAAEEPQKKPLWEIQARLDGGAPPVFSRNIKELLGEGGLERVLSGHTVLRAAGFENDKTPESDWIAEIHGIKEVKEILSTDKLGTKCAAWSGGPETLMLAGPAANKGQAIEEIATLKDDIWLSCFIDMDQIKKDGVKSRLLKLTKNLSFTANGTGEVVTVTLRPLFDSPATATTVSNWLVEFQNLLRKVDINSQNPPIVCEKDGAAVTVRLDFKEQDLQRLFDHIKRAVTEAGEEKPTDSNR